MRIVSFFPYYKPHISGVTVYMERVLNNLKRRGTRVRVAAFNSSTPGVAGGVETVHIPYWFKLSKGFISPQSLWYFLWEALRSDVVLINIPNGEGIFLAVYAKLLRKPLIVTYHCHVMLGNDVKSKIIMALLNTSVNMQLALADSIVGCPDYIESRPFYEKYKRKIVKALPPIEIVAAEAHFLKELLTKKRSKTWIGFVGRLAREKRVEDLLDAVKTMNDDSIELVIAGPENVVGEEDYQNSLIAKLDNSGIPYHRFTSLSDAELSAVYESLNILVLPSGNSTEAFGMVQAEAMLHGTPCVATDLPGVRLPVQLTGAGAIVRPADPSHLAKAISAVLSKNLKRSTTIEKAKKVFDPKKTYKVYAHLLLGD